MTARDNILKRLRQITPFEYYPAPKTRIDVSPVPDGTDLVALFTERATALSATVHHAKTANQAVEILFEILGDDRQILAWDFEHIPLENLEQALHTRGVTVAERTDSTVRVGITGADAALAATGSLIVSTQAGKNRHASLLPHVHVAIIRAEQILPHLEAWLNQQSQDLSEFRKVGNHIIITGASRTADIAMELVLGAHGPAHLHVIIV